MSVYRYPKISIITVCFNSAKTLEDTLASVATQTWDDIEHIVIDGGSTDGTLDILRRRAPQLAAIVSEPDDGIYDAMNKGAALSSGDYIAFLNSDDVYRAPTVVEDVATALASEDLDAVYGDVDFVRSASPEVPVRRFDSSRFVPSRLADGWMMAHPALFLRASIFRRSGGFRPEYEIAGDFELIARIFKGDDLRYRYLKRVLVRMTLGGASTRGVRSFFKRNNEVLRACRENGIRTNWLRLLSKYPRKLTELMTR